MNPSEVEYMLDITTKLKSGRVWPREMADKLKDVLTLNPSKHFKTVQTLKDELLDGKLQLKELDIIGGLNRILDISSKEEKNTIIKMLIETMCSHNTGLLIYGRLLDIEYTEGDGEKFPNMIIFKLQEIRKGVRDNSYIRENSEEFFKELKRISYYKEPYIPSTGEAIGYLEDGIPQMLEIGDNERNVAIQHLQNESDFVSYYSMKKTFLKLAKGEITSESVAKRANEIARMQKECELAEYMAEDEMLDEELQQLSSEKNIAEKND